MAHGVDVAGGTRVDETRHVRPRGRAARAHVVQGGVDAWQGPHESTRTPRWCHSVRGVGKWRAHGLVGPGDETRPQGHRFHTVSCQKLFRTYQFGELRVN